MPITIPDNVIGARLQEVLVDVRMDFEKKRDSVWKGTWSALVGYIGNKLRRTVDYSQPSKDAFTAGVLVKVGFGIVSTLHIPLVSHLTDACKITMDKLIEHFQKGALRSAFADVQPDAGEKEFMREQGEYVVLKVAQATVDAARKVEDAYAKVRDALGKVNDCESFYVFLTALTYYWYRIDRLNYYNSLVKTWATNVDTSLTKFDNDCQALQRATNEAAKKIIGDYATHLENCKGKQHCFFEKQWLHDYVVGEPTLVKRVGTPSNVPPGAPAPPVSPAPTPGSGGPIPKIQKPGLPPKPGTSPGAPPIKWNK